MVEIMCYYADKCRRLQLLIDKLKQSNNGKLEAQNTRAECCSETYTEGEDWPTECNSLPKSISDTCETESNHAEELNDDIPSIPFLHGSKRSLKL